VCGGRVSAAACAGILSRLQTIVLFGVFARCARWFGWYVTRACLFTERGDSVLGRCGVWGPRMCMCISFSCLVLVLGVGSFCGGGCVIRAGFCVDVELVKHCACVICSADHPWHHLCAKSDCSQAATAYCRDCQCFLCTDHDSFQHRGGRAGHVRDSASSIGTCVFRKRSSSRQGA
jgi:hypothetical protein